MAREKNDDSKNRGGMRGAKMPATQFERNQPTTSCCEEKYATEFGNPEELTRSTQGLTDYARRNKMKYS